MFSGISYPNRVTCPCCNSQQKPANFCSNCATQLPKPPVKCDNCPSTIYGNYCGYCAAPRPREDTRNVTPVVSSYITQFSSPFYPVSVSVPHTRGNYFSKLTDKNWYFPSKEFEGNRARITHYLLSDELCIVLPNKRNLFSENPGLENELQRISNKHPNLTPQVFVVCGSGESINPTLKSKVENSFSNCVLTRITIN